MFSTARLAVIARVAERGTIVGAAEELHLTPSAVSHQLSRLEKEMGVPLVERGPRSLRLTDAGRRLAEYARSIEELMERAHADITAHGFGQAGRLRLGFFASGGLRLVPQALSVFLAAHPDVDLGLFPGQTHELVPAVHGGDLDLAVVFDHSVDPWSMPRDVVAETLLHDEQFLVLPREHPRAGERELRLSTLAGEPWIATHGLPPAPSVLERICATAGVVPRIRCRTDHYEVALGLVRAGVGITLVPRMVLADVSSEGVAVARLEGLSLHRRIMIVRRPGNPNPLAASFTNILTAAAQRLDAAGQSTRPGVAPVGRPASTTAVPST